MCTVMMKEATEYTLLNKMLPYKAMLALTKQKAHLTFRRIYRMCFC